MSHSSDYTVSVFIWQPLPHARTWCPCQGSLQDRRGMQQHPWAPGRQCSILHLRALLKGKNLSSMAQGPVPMRGCVAPLIFPGAKPTSLASSLIEVPWTSKEGIRGIASQLPACASRESGSQILHFSSSEHRVGWHLPAALEVQCDRQLALANEM